MLVVLVHVVVWTFDLHDAWCWGIGREAWFISYINGQAANFSSPLLCVGKILEAYGSLVWTWFGLLQVILFPIPSHTVMMNSVLLPRTSFTGTEGVNGWSSLPDFLALFHITMYISLSFCWKLGKVSMVLEDIDWLTALFDIFISFSVAIGGILPTLFLFVWSLAFVWVIPFNLHFW